MIDNSLVQIALVFLAFYVIMQIMNKDGSQEYLDTIVTVDPNSNVNIQQDPSSHTNVSVIPGDPTIVNLSPNGSLTNSSGFAVNFPVASDSPTPASAFPVATETASAALSTSQIPAPLTSVSETLLAAAPPGASAPTTDNSNIFAAEPADVDQMFGKRGFIDPADLIPKNVDAELYGNLLPSAALNQNFLQNRWSMGIDTSVGKFNYTGDLRGSILNPITISSPWNNATKMPDVYRKSLAEIS